MKSAKKTAIFMRCLPAKREQEVTSSVIDGPQSVVWDGQKIDYILKGLDGWLIRA